MRLGENQKKLLKKLEQKGHIKRLGWTYKQLATNPKNVRDTQILSFVDYVFTHYKNVEFICEGSLDNSILIIK